MTSKNSAPWSTLHTRVYNHLDYFLKESLENADGFLTLNEIRKLLKEKTGFLFHPETLRKYNRRYAEKYGMGPLCQFGEKFKLNHCLYELKEIKPNKIYLK